MADTTLPGSYISVADFTQSFTGLDPSILKPGELARAIRRASGRVDTICKQTLYATVDVAQLQEDGYPEGYSVDLGDGQLKLFPTNFPVRQIQALTYSFAAADTPNVIATTRCRVLPRQVVVDGDWTSYRHNRPPMFVALTYINGWAVALSSTANNAGDSTTTFKPQPGQSTVQGFLPGTQVELQDQTPEIAKVLSVTGNIVTWTAPLVSSHAVDTMAAPPEFSDAQQATILLTADLIKTRGIGPLVFKDERIESAGTGQQPDEYLRELAIEMLREFTVFA